MGVHVDSLIAILKCTVIVSVFQQNAAAIAECLRQVWVQFYCLSVGADCMIKLMFLPELIAPPNMI